MVCYATTSLSQKLLDFLCAAQKHELALQHRRAASLFCGKGEHCVEPKSRSKKLWTDNDSRLGLWGSVLHSQQSTTHFF